MMLNPKLVSVFALISLVSCQKSTPHGEKRPEFDPQMVQGVWDLTEVENLNASPSRLTATDKSKKGPNETQMHQFVVREKYFFIHEFDEFGSTSGVPFSYTIDGKKLVMPPGEPKENRGDADFEVVSITNAELVLYLSGPAEGGKVVSSRFFYKRSTADAFAQRSRGNTEVEEEIDFSVGKFEGRRKLKKEFSMGVFLENLNCKLVEDKGGVSFKVDFSRSKSLRCGSGTAEFDCYQKWDDFELVLQGGFPAYTAGDSHAAIQIISNSSEGLKLKAELKGMETISSGTATSCSTQFDRRGRLIRFQTHCIGIEGSRSTMSGVPRTRSIPEVNISGTCVVFKNESIRSL